MRVARAVIGTRSFASLLLRPLTSESYTIQALRAVIIFGALLPDITKLALPIATDALGPGALIAAGPIRTVARVASGSKVQCLTIHGTAAENGHTTQQAKQAGLGSKRHVDEMQDTQFHGV